MKKFLVLVVVSCFLFSSVYAEQKKIGVVEYNGEILNLNLSNERWRVGDHKKTQEFFPGIPVWYFPDKKNKTSFSVMYFAEGLESKNFFMEKSMKEFWRWFRKVPSKNLPKSLESIVEDYTKTEPKEILLGGRKGFLLETNLNLVNLGSKYEPTFFSCGNFFIVVHNYTKFSGENGHRSELFGEIFPNISVYIENKIAQN
ncbi:hypothetical protein KKH36_02710 [Patescibacteria group bacterium]|nr:hypothetical protein [Patescibacteria group bacterium]